MFYEGLAIGINDGNDVESYIAKPIFFDNVMICASKYPFLLVFVHKIFWITKGNRPSVFHFHKDQQFCFLNNKVYFCLAKSIIGT